MAFSVLILGSGSALPTINSNQTAQLVTLDDNLLFLVDCGEGTQTELRKNKVKMQKIDDVFISHLHGDHYFGLVGLLSTMNLLGRKKTLTIHCPEGLKEIVDIQLNRGKYQLSFPINYNPVTASGQLLLDHPRIQVTSLSLKHRIPCYGFLFREKEKLRKLKVSAMAEYRIPVYARKGITEGADFLTEEGELVSNQKITEDPPSPQTYAYCSDTAFHQELIDQLSSIDLLYHEATFLDREKERAKKTYHSTAKDAARVANLSGAKKLLMGHFSNRYKKKDGFLQEARTIFKESYVAEEGKVYLVGE